MLLVASSGIFDKKDPFLHISYAKLLIAVLIPSPVLAEVLNVFRIQSFSAISFKPSLSNYYFLGDFSGFSALLHYSYVLTSSLINPI